MGAVFVASVAISINQFKVPPVMQHLMNELHADMVTGGWLMSVFSVANIVLSIPIALILVRLGSKTTGMLALGCVTVGAVIGGLASNATILLVGRTIEGVSAALISIVAPAMISAWFEPQRRGLPMGIWAAWVPVGNVMIFNAAHPLQAAFGWRSIWWVGAGIAVLALSMFGLTVTVPVSDSRRASVPIAPKMLGRTLLNGSSWLLALAFFALSFGLIGYNTWVPSFLIETMSLSVQAASFYASLMFLAGMLGNVVAGLVVNRTRNRHRLLTLVFLVTGLLFLFSFRLGSERLLVPYMGILGFVSNFIPTLVFTLAPETVERPEFAGMAMAMTAVCAGAGALIGPPVLGAVISRIGWAAGGICLAIVMLFGMVVSSLAWRRWTRQ